MPTTYCSVFGCRVRGGSHTYPVDPEKREKWVQAVRRVDGTLKTWTPTKNSVVCPKHFKPDDYVKETMFGFKPRFNRLLPTAVPSIFPQTQAKGEKKQDPSQPDYVLAKPTNTPNKSHPVQPEVVLSPSYNPTASSHCQPDNVLVKPTHTPNSTSHPCEPEVPLPSCNLSTTSHCQPDYDLEKPTYTPNSTRYPSAPNVVLLPSSYNPTTSSHWQIRNGNIAEYKSLFPPKPIKGTPTQVKTKKVVVTARLHRLVDRVRATHGNKGTPIAFKCRVVGPHFPSSTSKVGDEENDVAKEGDVSDAVITHGGKKYIKFKASSVKEERHACSPDGDQTDSGRIKSEIAEDVKNVESVEEDMEVMVSDCTVTASDNQNTVGVKETEFVEESNSLLDSSTYSVSLTQTANNKNDDNVAGNKDSVIERVHNVIRYEEKILYDQSLKGHKFNIPKISLEIVQENDELCKLCTGISWTVFVSVYEFLVGSLNLSEIKTKKFSLIEQLFFTLVKLRQNLRFEVISTMKRISEEVLRSVIWKWVEIIYCGLNFVLKWPVCDSNSLQEPLKSAFPRLTALVDVHELFLDTPSDQPVSQDFPDIKLTSKVKIFMAFTPSGAISFLSKAAKSTVQTRLLIADSGYIDKKYHAPGDQIIAAKKINLDYEFECACKAQFFSYGLNNKQKDVYGKLRHVIYDVRKATGLIKERFTILKGALPVSLNRSQLPRDEVEERRRVDMLVGTCAILTNLGDSV